MARPSPQVADAEAERGAMRPSFRQTHSPKIPAQSGLIGQTKRITEGVETRLKFGHHGHLHDQFRNLLRRR